MKSHKLKIISLIWISKVKTERLYWKPIKIHKLRSYWTFFSSVLTFDTFYSDKRINKQHLFYNSLTFMMTSFQITYTQTWRPLRVGREEGTPCESEFITLSNEYANQCNLRVSEGTILHSSKPCLCKQMFIILSVCLNTFSLKPIFSRPILYPFANATS